MVQEKRGRMTSDCHSDPLQPSEPWIERPAFYEAGLHLCELVRGEPPGAGFIQQFVAAQEEMQRPGKVKS